MVIETDVVSELRILRTYVLYLGRQDKIHA